MGRVGCGGLGNPYPSKCIPIKEVPDRHQECSTETSRKCPSSEIYSVINKLQEVSIKSSNIIQETLCPARLRCRNDFIMEVSMLANVDK